MHWYDREGNPQHFVPSKSGKLRASTLRDARKHGWMPSVTSVLDIMAKPGLDQWKINKGINAAITLDRNVMETDEEYTKRILIHSKKESEEASARGTRIHNMLEKAFKKEEQPKGEDEAIFNSVKSLLDVNCGDQEWQSEVTFSEPQLGYGGMVDLISDEWAIDFKTKEFGADHKQLAYESMAYQLMAYAVTGVERSYRDTGEATVRRMANIFISSTNPGLTVFHEWKKEDYERYWEIFSSSLTLWKNVKRYWPEKHYEGN
jgi:hypothetical protein